MSWFLAPSLAQLLRQVDSAYPYRDRSSDGTIGDPEHVGRVSDHNPDASGEVLAIDVTDDPDTGFDIDNWMRRQVAEGPDPRIKYMISDWEIWSSARAGEGWRVYTGPNPHTRHGHLSAHKHNSGDTSPWWYVAEPEPEPLPLPPIDEDDIMTRLFRHPSGATMRIDGAFFYDYTDGYPDDPKVDTFIAGTPIEAIDDRTWVAIRSGRVDSNRLRAATEAATTFEEPVRSL